ncbi:MAG TPA: alpha/beta hydrolase [Solirubrobacter sp.]|nr:alpha/beta hydrolase [Solirubrobacter sp.]
MRRAVLLALVAAALAVFASPASAACPAGARCGTLTVPLDHHGGTAGTLPLAYATLPATGARSGTLIFLSGGPGQAAIPFLREFARRVKPLRRSYDIVAVDQRGTGESGAVSCSGCRAFLNTPETARDLEDLRAALGADQLTLYGVSYGAKVAAEYARRYPERTAALVLDSPVPVDGLDGSGELRLLAARRVLREVCFPGPCSATVRDPGAALTAAVERLPLLGPRVDASGRVRTARVTEAHLYRLLAASDLDPALRAVLPAAIASAAAGDAAPLLHLGELRRQPDDPHINLARFLATTCIEARLPWAPETPVAERQFVPRPAAFAPFRPRTVLATSATTLCADWPPTPRPERVAYPGPDVPVLVISGRDDLRTPLEDARRTAAQYPDATLLAVPGVGHSVLRNDVGDCARDGLVAFLSGAPIRGCARRQSSIAAPYVPASLRRLHPTGRALAAVAATLTGVAYDSAFERSRWPGLRAGYVRATRRTLELHGVEWVRGVRVSGALDQRGRGTLTVRGRVTGTIRYAGGRARGTLDGRSISLK